MGVCDWTRGADPILDHVQILAQTKNRLPLHSNDMVRSFKFETLLQAITDFMDINIILFCLGSLSIGWLSVGINASAMCLFSVGFISQWWMRTRYPRWFAKYNYILAAALDGGTQVRSTRNLSNVFFYN